MSKTICFEDSDSRHHRRQLCTLFFAAVQLLSIVILNTFILLCDSN